MTSQTDDWGNVRIEPSEKQQRTNEALLKVVAIRDIEPLDDQFGIDPKKTVPDALYDAFFGQPQPSDTEIAAAGGDPKSVPAMQTYALLDAAKVTHLPELLAASDLEHRCLFKGDAYNDLKDAAPWLVRLEEGNDFARNLFTKGDAPWHLWGAEAGIYIRSRGSLEELWKHFRKFTRIQDENGKWFYFRFWEVGCLIDYVKFLKHNGQLTYGPMFGVSKTDPKLPLVQGFVDISEDQAEMFGVAELSQPSHTQQGFDVSILHYLALKSHAKGFVQSYYKDQEPPADKAALIHAQNIAINIVMKYYRYGFKSRYHLGSFTYWALALNADIETQSTLIKDHIDRVSDDPNDRFVLMAREMKQLFGNKIRNYRGN